jgi:probable HAF family extracellular repeat protein
METFANRISNSGLIVGAADTPDGRCAHATLWTGADRVVDLGTLGGPCSFAYDVTDDGIVVGESGTGEGAVRAFVWTASLGMRALPTLDGDYTQALGINNRGEIVGVSLVSLVGGTEGHAFYWSQNTGIVDVGTAGFNSFAHDISDEGVIVGGRSPTGSDVVSPIAWCPLGRGTDHSPGPGDRWAVVVLGSGNRWALAEAVNERGQVAGYTGPSLGGRAILWDGVDCGAALASADW